LTNSQCYENLRHLCLKIGGRMSGSPQAEEAVKYTHNLLKNMNLDTAYLQPVKVPHWIRGEKEKAFYIENKKRIEISCTALGNSVGTGKKGIKAPLLEVYSLNDLEKIGKDKIQGKIIFFNHPFIPTYFDTFDAYSEAAAVRGYGAAEAAKYGAVGVVVRSMTQSLDDFVHTGSTRYQLNVPQIPAIAISTNGAEELSKKLKINPNIDFEFRTTCQMLEDVQSYNVIAEIKGTEKPQEIITFGGHLDSWDLGQGAHDDGAGCMQTIEVLRIMKALNIKPKRTIRAVLFMNEENGIKGGHEYARVASENVNEKHIVAIESDRGGFTPRGFSIDAPTDTLQKIKRWLPLMENYGIQTMKSGKGGVDINPLKPLGTVLIGYVPDSQRYFDLHHTSQDTFDKVNKRELELGAGAMTSLIYLFSQYGIN
jgi:hypothetical protein